VKNFAVAFVVVGIVLFTVLVYHVAPAAVAVYALATGAPWAHTACAVLVLLLVASNVGRVWRKLGKPA
jgi:hypothetical protein